jgi:predicted Zn-dependent peptidase
MYEDEPSDKVHDVLARAIFGDHPLGRPILGTAEVVGNVPVPEIAAYHRERYTGTNLVVAAAGSVDDDQVVELVRAACEAPRSEPNGFDPAPDTIEPRLCFHEKETEQYHLCVGGRGLARGDDRRFALRVLDSILGGSTSSRLFQEVREKRGLAYSVYSYPSQYVDTGQVAVYVGTRPENVPEAVSVIAAELHKLQQEPVAAEELERAKENLKGRTVLGMESTLARMNRLGSSLLMGVPLLTLDETLALIDAVTAEDVSELARELFAPERMSAAAVGASEGDFRRALEPLNPALAAAA